MSRYHKNNTVNLGILEAAVETTLDKYFEGIKAVNILYVASIQDVNLYGCLGKSYCSNKGSLP